MFFQKCFMNFFSLFSSKSFPEKIVLCRIVLIFYLEWKYCHVVAVFALSAEKKRPCKGSFKFPFTYTEVKASCKGMKWIETTLSCQYITALNQLEKQHGVSSMEMDFHLIRCLVLARGGRRVSQQSGLCASCLKPGASQCSDGSPMVVCLDAERRKAEGKYQSLKSHSSFKWINSFLLRSALCEHQ